MMQTVDNGLILNWALYYAILGWKVFPVTPGQKAPPLTAHGFRDASNDPEQIKWWWRQWSTANIALATGTISEIADFETDKKPYADGEKSLAEWAINTGIDIPETWCFQSGGGGIHRLFHGSTPSKTGILPAVDVRGEGGYAILPPSRHPSGQYYVWMENHAPHQLPVASLPAETFFLLADERSTPLEAPEEIPEGTRNNTLFKLACKLRGMGLDENEILPAMTVVNENRCIPPMDASEVEHICRSAVKYAPGELREESAARAIPQLVKAADVVYEPPRWTIAPYFQQGKGTLIQGDNGSGKTAFMCAIAAHITTGAPLLGMLPVATPGNVLILSVEDDLPVLRGRIEADGGDLNKCHFMTNVAGLTFNSPEVEAAVKAVQARMVIFDPFQAFLGAKVDMFRPNETRPELSKLFEMCDRNDCACVIIAHMGKSGGDRSPVNRSLGSVDIPAVMRSILQLTINPENENERVMVHVKCSNAPKGRSIAYTIGDRGGVHWTGFSPMTVEDLNAVVKRKEKGVPYEQEPLVQVFRQLIADRPSGGFWSYAELAAEGAKILGYPPV